MQQPFRALRYGVRSQRPVSVLNVSFLHPASPKVIGPYASIRFEGETVRERLGGRPVATHQGRLWDVHGALYSRLECSSRVIVRFESMGQAAPRQFGPYDKFSCVDGVAYVDERVFAVLDRDVRDWFSYDSGQRWPVMVVIDVERQSTE